MVVGDAGGAPETVLDGRTGRIVDPRDPAALATALSDLLADPDTAAAMGAAARTWMREAWPWPSRAARLHTLLTVENDVTGSTRAKLIP